MKERPILFSAPMVRAILAGTKTQTRRVACKGTTPAQYVSAVQYEPGRWRLFDAENASASRAQYTMPPCPYGQPGDRLWVRETWTPDPPIDDTWASTAWNGCGRVISEVPERFRHPRFCCYAADWLHGPIKWRPSIHMPRWASRITLEITGVRVERLQDISEADAIAEGAPSADLASGRECIFPHQGTHRWGFQLLWQQINGLDSWDANPWVWVIEFARVEAG